MKILVPLLTFLISTNAWSISATTKNVSLGLGIFSSRGVLGLSGDYFLTENHALTFATGADLIGTTTSLGYKYFGAKDNVSGTIWDKCFFLLECDSHFFVGALLQHAGKGNAEIISEGDGLRIYETNSKHLAMAVIGSRAIFKNGITMDGEISYRNIFSGGQLTQVSGKVVDRDRATMEMGYRSFGLGIAIGYNF